MHITPVERADFDEWLTMRQALYTGLDETFHRREMAAIVASPEMGSFIGRSSAGGEAIGFMDLSLRNIVDGCISGPVGYIEGLYIRPGFQGQGLGREFVAFAESWFLSRNCNDAATDSELENEAAQAFFRGAGFTETWRIVEFRKSLK